MSKKNMSCLERRLFFVSYKEGIVGVMLFTALPLYPNTGSCTWRLRGTGLGAERGVLIHSGVAFQRLKDVDTVLFDKTGTL